MKAIIQKLLKLLFSVWFCVTLVFFSIRLAPGDPVERILGPDAKQEQIVAYRTQLGLDRSFHAQYFSFLKSVVVGDFGKSLFSKKEVIDLVGQRIFPTTMIAFSSVIIAFFLGSVWGVSAAIANRVWKDILIRMSALLVLSIPVFSLSPLLVSLFSIKLNIFPVSGWGSFRHVVLPVMSLALPLGAVLSRVARNRYLEEKNGPWVQVLRAKGLPDLQIVKRIFRVSLSSVVTVSSIQLSIVLAGTLVTETIYDIPGVGSLLYGSIQNRDYPVIQALIVYTCSIYLFVYFLSELINEKIDPRLKE